MSNCYTEGASLETVDCDEHYAAQLAVEFQHKVEDHGIEAQWCEGRMWLSCDNHCDPEEINASALELLGHILKGADVEFMVLGVAHTCDKAAPGAFGGDYYRFYQDGSFCMGRLVFLEADHQTGSAG